MDIKNVSGTPAKVVFEPVFRGPSVFLGRGRIGNPDDVDRQGLKRAGRRLPGVHESVVDDGIGDSLVDDQPSVEPFGQSFEDLPRLGSVGGDDRDDFTAIPPAPDGEDGLEKERQIPDVLVMVSVDADSEFPVEPGFPQPGQSPAEMIGRVEPDAVGHQPPEEHVHLDGRPRDFVEEIRAEERLSAAETDALQAGGPARFHEGDGVARFQAVGDSGDPAMGTSEIAVGRGREYDFFRFEHQALEA